MKKNIKKKKKEEKESVFKEMMRGYLPDLENKYPDVWYP